MNNATVFSRTWPLLFAAPASRREVEAELKNAVNVIGGKLAYKGIIPGHIKVLVQFSPGEDFWFLSLTKMGTIDEKRPAAGYLAGEPPVESIKLTVAVLVFNHDLKTVEAAVDDALSAARLAVKGLKPSAATVEEHDDIRPKGKRFANTLNSGRRKTRSSQPGLAFYSPGGGFGFQKDCPADWRSRQIRPLGGRRRMYAAYGTTGASKK